MKYDIGKLQYNQNKTMQYIINKQQLQFLIFSIYSTRFYLFISSLASMYDFFVFFIFTFSF